MNNKTREDIIKITDNIDGIIDDLENIRLIEETKLNNIPENLFNSDLYTNMEEGIEIIDDAIEILNEIITSLQELSIN